MTEPSRIDIRDFAEADRAAVVALWRECLEIPPHNDPDRDIALCRLSRHGRLFVALADGTVAGTVMAGHDGHRGWLYYLATTPLRRRAGIATRLLGHAEAWLASCGVRKVNLSIRPANVAVEAFYAKRGYAAETRTLMGKHLATSEPQAPVQVVITYLQMLARVAAPPPPRPALPLVMLRAERPSLAFYRFLYDTVGAPWGWYERRLMDDASLAAIVHDPKVEITTLYAGGEPAGYAELDRRRDGEVELAYFGLMPQFIGRRLGPFFLRQTIDAAWAGSPTRVWVHTCSLDHPKAVALYQRAGFRPYRQETRTIVDPRPLLRGRTETLSGRESGSGTA